jgi:glutamine amidotransferase
VKIAIVKYNAGNTASVVNALSRLGMSADITDDAERITTADRVIFPGVGEASSAMAYLRERKLDDVVRSLKQPVLGVCLGMQLLCAFSEENDTECLGLLPGNVRRFPAGDLKVPHMGWNEIRELHGPMFSGVPSASYMYFVHGFYVEAGEHTTAVCVYGVPFSAALSHNNFHAVQFHAEKSGSLGEKILENFLEL